MVLRERSAGMYYIAGYFLAKLCAELPFQLIFPCIFVRAPSPPLSLPPPSFILPPYARGH